MGVAGLSHATLRVERPAQEEPGVTRGRVLAIDDEEDVLTLLQELLERAGFDVIPAVGGEAGLIAL